VPAVADAAPEAQFTHLERISARTGRSLIFSILATLTAGFDRACRAAIALARVLFSLVLASEGGAASKLRLWLDNGNGGRRSLHGAAARSCSN
jgi:hypothetical protein